MPAYLAAVWVASAMIQTAKVRTAPTIAGAGTSAPRTFTFSGVRYGRGRSGSEMRSLITAICVAVNASRTPNENTPARNETSRFTNEVAITIALETIVTLTIAQGETSVRR